MPGPSAERSLVAAWRELLARHATVSCALERRLQERHGLGISEFEVLDLLAEDRKDKCRAQELADAVHLSQSALSRVISRLERDGLVERALCEFDRRGIYVGLTDAGRDRHATARPTYIEVLATTLSATTPS